MSIYFDSQLGPRPSLLQERAIREAYSALYSFAGAQQKDHFVFTSSGAEAVNQALFAAYLDITRKTGKNHFICSALDEAPAVMAMGRLQQELNCLFQMAPARSSGKNCVKEIEEMITPRTALISLSWANALTGVVQPAAEIGSLCRARNILFHIDATHVLGKGDFNFETSGADLMSFSCPTAGMGGLFIRQGVEMSPLILGGAEQAGMRAGAVSTQALLSCAAWAKRESELSDYILTEVSRLRALFEALITSQIPKARVLFQEQERICSITSFLFPGVASEALYFALMQKKLHAAFGGGQIQHFSHLLKACQIREPDCYTALSFALPSSVTQEEVERAAVLVIETVQLLQKYTEAIV